MSRQTLPTEMQTAFHEYPDWVVNVAFGDALEWLAHGIRRGWINEDRITPEWLLAEAQRVYNMAREEWEYDPQAEEES